MRHALIFAAGRGERMQPLTDATPKPLLPVGGKPLIGWLLEKLAAAGCRDVVINTSHLAAQFPATLGDGARYGLAIHYVYEGPTALETGGGMLHALPLLGTGPFLALNGDIWCDVDLARLPGAPRGLAHLLMVDNPPQHPDGDFVLHADGSLGATGAPRLTFAGVGVYRPEILEGWRDVIGDAATQAAAPRFRLAPILIAAMRRGEVSGCRHAGEWADVGTPERLAALRARVGG